MSVLNPANISIAQYKPNVKQEIINSALAKLERIIAREGDLGGERRTQEYLNQLIAEEIQIRAIRDYCMAHYKEDRNGRL